ncbi:MAG TPA: TIGR04282 family arsenosugar biosynthesis glycosyltransferase [Oscillatoriaceae cyanobacterium M33_DOE_052]|uniref:Glycosyltransferase n=1 Tax=Planktothricoides sp. SpSt-374 TaxID=2282167 RepID=A0A7C3VIG8_9CYAN|nr:TIGR04282 family arsenosugar biosynthesis glycosyltransferase [Oscillatoriaceae cyanobacterium M33_DOE_052]
MELLIIFTRYPEPGKAKTRLIPALGAEGAARLHRRLTERMLQRVLAAGSELSWSVSLEVWFAGGNEELMRQWLGEDVVYRSQGEGDLGERMARAFAAAFGEGMERVAIAGTDCPDLGPDLIAELFQRLRVGGNDRSPLLVLGPALDGGYYTIGLRRFLPELFTGISWSTSKVLQQTIDKANFFGYDWQLLPELGDIDRPEDLWRLTVSPLREEIGFVEPNFCEQVSNWGIHQLDFDSSADSE